MKDFKGSISNELHLGFNEVHNLLNVFKVYIETLTGKQKDETMDEFFVSQMKSLENITITQFRKVTDNLIKTHAESKNKDEHK